MAQIKPNSLTMGFFDMYTDPLIRRKSRRLLTGGVASIALLALAATVPVHAEDAASAQPQAAAADSNPLGFLDNLTYGGVTLYGTIDVGAAHQSHGASFNRDFSTGLEYLVQKNDNRSVNAVTANGLSQSRIGLSGDEEFLDGYAAIFKLETGFDPLSMHLADGLKSMTTANGLSANVSDTNGDSSRAGQWFNGAAYAGVKTKDFGTLTFGRQNGILADDITTYDPQGGSYAFSPIGYSGAAAGVGDTEDARLDSSLKYMLTYGPVRGGVQYQFTGKQPDLGGATGVSGSATEVDLGGDYKGFSGDMIYSQKKDAIGAAPLSAAQAATLPAGSLAGTVSDNSSVAAMGKYTLGAAKIYGGYERIRFANPDSLLPTDTTTIGGYMLSSLTQNSYNTNKILQIYWTGLKYSVTDKLDITGAYYGYTQNNYSGAACTAMSSAGSSKCDGNLNAVSLVAVYNVVKHFDVYGGAMLSQVNGGLASGYVHDHTIDPMVGARLSF
jgi:predicted porin